MSARRAPDARADGGLLAALEGPGWHSGAEIAARLGVSRAAVWKRIERLRERGYDIEASAGRGYRLVRASERLLPEEVLRHWRPVRFAGRVVHRDTIDSTNRLAVELARGGAAEGTVVIAEQQTAGRGRLGRSWASPANVNLYCSVILRPALPPLEVPRLTLVAGLAVAEAIAATRDRVAPQIKWPNDVLLDGRKVAGVLTELDAEAERVRFVIVGIGVNLNARRSDFPRELARKATSLALATGERIDRAAFAGRLLRALEEAYGVFCTRGFAALRARYEELHCLAGRTVSIDGRPPVSGVVRGVDDEGALLVATRGELRRVVAGEVTLRGTYRRLRR